MPGLFCDSEQVISMDVAIFINYSDLIGSIHEVGTRRKYLTLLWSGVSLTSFNTSRALPSITVVSYPRRIPCSTLGLYEVQTEICPTRSQSCSHFVQVRQAWSLPTLFLPLSHDKAYIHHHTKYTTLYTVSYTHTRIHYCLLNCNPASRCYPVFCDFLIV